MALRIMLVDDNMLYRQALHMLLDLQDGIEVVAELPDGKDALQALKRSCPDVVCMDIGMQVQDGLTTTRQLLQHQPDLKVIGLSAHAERQHAADMLGAGAWGYVVKGGKLADLLHAIRTVSQGAVYMDPLLGIQPVPEPGAGAVLPLA